MQQPAGERPRQRRQAHENEHEDAHGPPDHLRRHAALHPGEADHLDEAGQQPERSDQHHALPQRLDMPERNEQQAGAGVDGKDGHAEAAQPPGRPCP